MIELTVVIPTYNRAAELRRCLDALALQSASRDAFEVVVVNDGSRDATAQVLAEYEAPFLLRVEEQPNSGQPTALNRGIAAASGAYCLFVDDDVVADRALVAEHLRAQRDEGGVLGLGALRLRLVGGGGGLAQYFADWWEAHYRRFDEGARAPDFWACYSGNLSVPTATLRASGGFDESLSRSFDVELSYRLVSGGLRIVYLPRAVGEQRYGKGFRGIVTDFDRAGAAAVALHRRHPELIRYAPLGDFAQGGSAGLVARRLMLAIRAPVWPFALVDPFLRRRPSVRLFRFLQLYCFWRSLRDALHNRDEWRRLTHGPVILMYHALARPGERASRFVLPPAKLRRQLAWLRFRRRRVISLDEYVAHRRELKLPPSRSIVLTFDDGYADNAAVQPLLRSNGMKATFFIVTDLMGKANAWDADGPLAGRPLLSWEAARVLEGEEITFGAHTLTHPRLAELDPADAKQEIEGSRSAIAEHLGKPPAHFAYPFGNLSEPVQELVASAGFVSACSIEPGANGPAIPVERLRRLEVRGTRSLLGFMIDVWLGRPLREEADDAS